MYKNLQGGSDPKIRCKRIAPVPFCLPMAHPEAPRGNCRPETPPILAVATQLQESRGKSRSLIL